jgi:hypothetical protein
MPSPEKTHPGLLLLSRGREKNDPGCVLPPRELRSLWLTKSDKKDGGTRISPAPAAGSVVCVFLTDNCNISAGEAEDRLRRKPHPGQQLQREKKRVIKLNEAMITLRSEDDPPAQELEQVQSKL